MRKMILDSGSLTVSQKSFIDDLNDLNQWVIDHESNKILITVAGNDNPNRSNTRIGLIHPWALRRNSSVARTSLIIMITVMIKRSGQKTMLFLLWSKYG